MHPSVLPMAVVLAHPNPFSPEYLAGTAPTDAAGRNQIVFVSENPPNLISSGNCTNKHKTTWSISLEGDHGSKVTAVGRSAIVQRIKHKCGLLVMDESGMEPMAYVEKQSSDKIKYNLYGFHPMFPSHPPHPIKPGHAHNMTYDDKDLYLWAIIEGGSSSSSYSERGALNVGLYRTAKGFTACTVTLATATRKFGLFGDNMRVVKMDDLPAAILRKGKFPDHSGAPQGPGWKCTNAPGFDPVLLICLICVYDDQYK